MAFSIHFCLMRLINNETHCKLNYRWFNYNIHIYIYMLILATAQYKSRICGCSRLGLRVRILLWHECLSLVSLVGCRVEASATGRSLDQRGSTQCRISECHLETSTMRRPRPTGGLSRLKKYVYRPIYFLMSICISPL